MNSISESVPDIGKLTTGLAVALGIDEACLTVVGREMNVYSSTFPSEFITCVLEDGRRFELFCKYTEDDIDSCFGHRGGAAYEAEIYRQVLTPGRYSTPRFHGSYHDAPAARSWLVLERLVDAHRITEVEDPSPGVVEAARWIGRLHSGEQRNAREVAGLIRHDAAYFEGWIHRTVEFSRPLHDHYPWLLKLCRNFGPLVDALSENEPLFIHGEFSPHNLLIRDGGIFALDWQSAAISVAEIDLAALTERWPEEDVRRCEREYAATRWPDGVPENFAGALEAARIHWHFRWLGDRPAWTLGKRSVWRFDQLHSSLHRFGIL